jgi:hypothetical protein
MRESQSRYWVPLEPFVRLWRRWMAMRDNQLPETARLDSENPKHNPTSSGPCRVGAWHSDDLLRRRMIAFGLDPDKLALSDPALLRHLQKCCAQCQSPENCALDLTRTSAGQPWQDPDDWRDYCENVLALEMLIALRSRSHVP